MQDDGLDTVDANTTLGFDDDERDYGIAARMLQILNCTRVVMLTNNPAKLDGLAKAGIEITSRIPLETPINADNLRYLTAKASRAGHRLDHVIASLAADAEDGSGNLKSAHLTSSWQRRQHSCASQDNGSGHATSGAEPIDRRAHFPGHLAGSQSEFDFVFADRFDRAARAAFAAQHRCRAGRRIDPPHCRPLGRGLGSLAASDTGDQPRARAHMGVRHPLAVDRRA